MSTVETVDPICLAAKIVDACDNNCCCCCGEMDLNSVPQSVSNVFDEDFIDGDGREVFVTLGLFTIIRLLREVQIIVPSIDYCIPENECISSTEDNPCELFERLTFPVDEFFPPEKTHFDSMGLDDRIAGCGCNRD